MGVDFNWLVGHYDDVPNILATTEWTLVVAGIPTRHLQLKFCLMNVGAICFQYAYEECLRHSDRSTQNGPNSCAKSLVIG